jgi:hypothetical protein
MFQSMFAMSPPAVIHAAVGDVRDATVFAPFSIRFRPFMGGRDGHKTPCFRAFYASTVENSV